VSRLLKIISLAKASTSAEVYSDFIPENESAVAVAITNVALSSSRALSGDKHGRVDVWRATIVGDDADVDSVVNDLELIDNTSNADFTNIYTQLIQYAPKGIDDPVRRAFLDITTYS
jgi:hypothetical protein